jgi:hypothetical protein
MPVGRRGVGLTKLTSLSFVAGAQPRLAMVNGWRVAGVLKTGSIENAMLTVKRELFVPVADADTA